MKKVVEMQGLFRSRQYAGKFACYNKELMEKPDPPLIHQVARFWLIERGKAVIKIQDREYEIGPGMIVSILPWQISEVVRVDECVKYGLLTYEFEQTSYIIKFLYNVGKEDWHLQTLMEGTPVLSCTKANFKIFRNLFDRIYQESGAESFLTEEKQASNAYLINMVVSVVLEFLHLMEQNNGQKKEKLSQDIRKSEIFPYIYSHLSEKLTLKHLSEMFYMSESAISSYITQTTGLSFFDLLNEMRVGRTLGFLLYTDLTLGEIAEILGFVDSAHISKVFAARMGMNANEYRRIYQNAGGFWKKELLAESYKIVSYIYRNYAEELTAQNVAECFHLSIKELNRVLLFQVEKNFNEFLNFVRVNRACELLSTTQMKVLDIAVEVGYTSEKALNRNFLKYRLMTPGQFRRKVTLEEP